MTKSKREQLDKLRVAIDGIRGELETISAEAQGRYDKMREAVKHAHKGYELRFFIEVLDVTCGSLEDIVSELEELTAEDE
jgi:hypothetical protein